MAKVKYKVKDILSCYYTILSKNYLSCLVHLLWHNKPQIHLMILHNSIGWSGSSASHVISWDVGMTRKSNMASFTWPQVGTSHWLETYLKCLLGPQFSSTWFPGLSYSLVSRFPGELLQENKPQCACVYQVSSCIMLAIVPLSKAQSQWRREGCKGLHIRR